MVSMRKSQIILTAFTGLVTAAMLRCVDAPVNGMGQANAGQCCEPPPPAFVKIAEGELGGANGLITPPIDVGQFREVVVYASNEQRNGDIQICHYMRPQFRLNAEEAFSNSKYGNCVGPNCATWVQRLRTVVDGQQMRFEVYLDTPDHPCAQHTAHYVVAGIR